jgi:hypothetical protein
MWDYIYAIAIARNTHSTIIAHSYTNHDLEKSQNSISKAQ